MPTRRTNYCTHTHTHTHKFYNFTGENTVNRTDIWAVLGWTSSCSDLSRGYFLELFKNDLAPSLRFFQCQLLLRHDPCIADNAKFHGSSFLVTSS